VHVFCDIFAVWIGTAIQQKLESRGSCTPASSGQTLCSEPARGEIAAIHGREVAATSAPAAEEVWQSRQYFCDCWRITFDAVSGGL